MFIHSYNINLLCQKNNIHQKPKTRKSKISDTQTGHWKRLFRSTLPGSHQHTAAGSSGLTLPPSMLWN